jgi:hypothetical protein
VQVEDDVQAVREQQVDVRLDGLPVALADE